jgi:glycosidase
VLSNHDQSRHVTRFLQSMHARDAATSDRLAKAAAVLVLTLRGTAFLYYGEEIALPDVDVPVDEIVDPPARRASWSFPWWNRDRARSPMPWSGARNGGFTTGRPWIRVIPDASRRNVEAQAADEESVLSTYRRLLAIRRESPALSGGTLRRLDTDGDDVLGYVRESEADRVLVIVNFASRSRRLRLPEGRWTRRLGTDPSTSDRVLSGEITLRGLEALVLADGRADGSATA